MVVVVVVVVVVMVVVGIVVVVGTGHALALQALVVSFDPLHFLPPLEACCMIVLKPDCVPPPHVLSHECQVHLPHLQFTGRGRGGLGGDGGSHADTMLMHCEQISVKLEILVYKNHIFSHHLCQEMSRKRQFSKAIFLQISLLAMPRGDRPVCKTPTSFYDWDQLVIVFQQSGILYVTNLVSNLLNSSITLM